MRTIKPLAFALALAIPAAVAAVPLAPTVDVAAPSAAATIAIDHLAAGIGMEDVASALVTDEYTSPHNGVTHVYLRQRVGGLEVLGADATVNVQDGEVLYAAGRMVDDIAVHASGAQRVNALDAVALGAIAVAADPRGLTDAPGLAYQVTTDRTQVRLAWSFQLRDDNDWWNISVDAETGEVLYSANWVDHEEMHEVVDGVVRTDDVDHSGATPLTAFGDVAPVLPPETVEDGSSYRVFPMPLENPMDNGAEHVLVESPASASASPFGWHDTDGAAGAEFTTTRGNNVHAYADTYVSGATVPRVTAGGVTVNEEPIPVGQSADVDPMAEPQGGDGLDFDFPIIDYDATAASYREAAVTNLFFWNNVMHDVSHHYGFDEAAGNFQATNYTGSGVGGDAVAAEAQDGSGALNANFATPADGSPGRMQMYLWVDAFRALGGEANRVPNNQVRDGDLDAGVIAHEYGHGISNRLVGGPSNVDCLRSHDERQGEGWSDFWSYALTMRDGDDGVTPRGIGNYVTYYDEYAGASKADQFGRGNDIRTGPGIRITPYSTAKLVNPSSYDTIKSAAEPHGVGYVWASMLWDLYWNLTDVHGFNANPYDSWDTGGNNLTIQLVVDGMKFAGCEPSFADARDAIIASDAALTGGENFCIIWDTFAKRGLGVDAVVGSSASKVDGENGFKTPPTCA
ncbi:MAG: hypothetical protein ACI9AD_001546 [Nitriliruptoraceae bacterium]